MSYKTKPQLKLYKYENSAFVLQAIIDDYQEISFSHNYYEAGDFTISINYNIPNAMKFERGMFVQFGNDPYMFGEIQSISDAIGEDGKGSQIRTITGKDARFIFKRRIIRNLNDEDAWTMTAKGELCLRNLINDQCGANAEEKRRLPVVNTIPESADAIGSTYSVSESYTNLYDSLVTIATQSEIGWRIKFDGELTLEVYEGSDLSDHVQFSTDYDSLANGEFKDSSESFANTVYVGGKGTGSDRDIYEGESAIGGESPTGLERYEAWDNQSGMTDESDYEAEALSMLSQYGQTLELSGQGLAKCPYIFKEQYNIGDTITVAFSGKSAKVQILSVTEHWSFGNYGIEFSFGKPQNDFSRQMQLILNQIQRASNKDKKTESVYWYHIPTDTTQKKSEVIYDRIGFDGTSASGGSTFTLYYNIDKTGAKTYHVYIKQLGGGNLTLTTGVTGKESLTLPSGTYVAIIYIDEEGNVKYQTATPTASVSSGSSLPVTSGAVASAISSAVGDWETYKLSIDAYIGWVLVGDITTWYNSTSTSITQNVLFNGFFTTQRLTGYPLAQSGFFTLSVGYFRNNSQINANGVSYIYQVATSNKIRACVVGYNNKYYLAFKIEDTPSRIINFLVTTNITPLFTPLPNTASVTEIFVAS